MKSQRPLRAWGMAARRLSINRGKKETLEMGIPRAVFGGGIVSVSGSVSDCAVSCATSRECRGCRAWLRWVFAGMCAMICTGMRASGIVQLQDAAERCPFSLRLASGLVRPWPRLGIGRSRGGSSPIMAAVSLPGTKDCKMERSDAQSPGLLRRSGARRDEYAWRAF